MKRLFNSVIIVATICLVAGNSESFGQIRFGGKSVGSRSTRSSSSNFRSSGRSGSSKTSRFGSSTSSRRSTPSISRTPSTNSIRKPSTSISKRPSGGNSLINRLPSRTPTSNKRPTMRLPTTKLPSRTPVTTPGRVTNPTGKLPGIISTRPSNGRIPGIGNSSLGRKPTDIKNPLPGRPATKLPGIIGKLPSPNVGSGTNNGNRRPALQLPWVPGKKPTSNNGGKTAINGGNVNVTKAGNWKDLANAIVRHNLHKNHWCQTRPAVCNWWNVYCKPISTCHVHQIHVCNWNRVTCGTAALPAVDVQWYLGLKGILLPGKGLGIDAVEPGSPAEAVGLQPGMVMTVCNGIPLVDETSMQEAIRISGGVLHMTLLSADGTQVLEGSVQMTQIASLSL